MDKKDSEQKKWLRNARASLKGHELYIPEGGEKQYELFRSLACIRGCTKSPNHENFIAMEDFRLENLPDRYKDQLVFNWIDMAANQTGHIASRHISADRPDTWPGRDEVYPCGSVKGHDLFGSGTGFVYDVDARFYTEGDGESCPCGRCSRSETRRTSFGKFRVLSAAHVIFDDSEAQRSDLTLFYRSTRSQVKVTHGVRVLDKHTEQDWCQVEFVTHERDVHVKLLDAWQQYKDLRVNVYDKYKLTSDNDLTVIVGHPHGCHQYVTIGRRTHREMVEKWNDWSTCSRYSYTANTCPGCSGAHVLMVGGLTGVLWWFSPPHSRGGKGENDEQKNESAAYMDIRLPKPT